MAKTQSRRERQRHIREGDTRLCPSCGAEFVARVETCSDCHIALVDPPEPLAPLAMAVGLYEVFHSTRPQSIRDATDALTLARIPHRLHDERVSFQGEFGTSALVSLSVLVREEDLPEAGRIIDTLAEDPSLSPEAIVAAASARPLAGDAPGPVMDADLLEALEYRQEGVFDIPAEINRWVVLAHVAGGVCWFLALSAYIRVRGGEPLWWIAVAGATVAALAAHARGRALRDRWRAEQEAAWD